MFPLRRVQNKTTIRIPRNIEEIQIHKNTVIVDAKNIIHSWLGFIVEIERYIMILIFNREK
jgi:hypothetical protein